VTRNRKVALTTGFAALALGAAAAVGSPATGYELSIYRSTPALFWVGAAVALAVSLAVSFRPGAPRLRYAALLLGGGTVWSVVALPVLRGYFFYGAGDALSHLGFALSFLGGKNPADLLHPGLHVLSLTIGEATGLPVRRALLVGVLVFFLLYFLFVPLCVREIAGDRAGLAVGAFTALLLLPLNNVATHVIAHPSSQTILFVPVVLFALVLFLRQGAGGRGVTAAGGLLGLVSVAVVLLHPQEALNTIVLFGAVLALQAVYRRLDVDHPITRHRLVLVPMLFLVSAWLLWAPRSPRVQSRIVTAYRSVFVSSPPPGGEVATRSLSLAVLGGSLGELFVKLFLASLVFSVIAGLAMLARSAGVLDDLGFQRWGIAGRLAPAERQGLTTYLAAGFLPLFGITGFVFLGAFGDHYFRFVGFLMMLVTLVAGGVIARGPRQLLAGRVSLSTARAAVVVLFVLLLPLAVLSVHPSPWIYQPSEQVTEQQYGGYQTAFQQRDPAIAFAGVRSGPRRFVEATYGPQSAATQGFPGVESGIPGPVFRSNLTTYYDEPRYVPVTTTDIEREVGLYRGFRYGSSGFRTLRSSPGIHRVQANEEFRLYLLSEDGDG